MSAIMSGSGIIDDIMQFIIVVIGMLIYLGVIWVLIRIMLGVTVLLISHIKLGKTAIYKWHWKGFWPEIELKDEEEAVKGQNWDDDGRN